MLMSNDIIDAVLEDEKELEIVRDFVSKKDKVSDIDKEYIREARALIANNEHRASSVYIVALLDYVCPYEVYDWVKEMATIMNIKNNPKFSMYIRTGHPVYDPYSLGTLRPILFKGTYNSIRNYRNKNKDLAEKAIEDNLLSFELFKKSTKKLSSKQAYDYLKKVKHFTDTVDKYTDYIFSITKASIELRNNLFSYNTLHNIASHIPSIDILDLTSDEETSAKYILVHFPTINYNFYKLNSTVIPRIFSSSEHSKLHNILVGVPINNKLDNINYNLWCAYLYVLSYAKVLLRNKQKTLTRVIDYILEEVTKDCYKEYKNPLKNIDTEIEALRLLSKTHKEYVNEST